jgi:hypothetical protein
MLAAFLAGVAVSGQPLAAGALDGLLGRLTKIVSVESLVRVFARQLNDFINTLLINNKVENRDQTKVVPIVSFGERKAVGAAQVSGSAEGLAAVKAVIQYEDIFSAGKFRVKALVPGDSADPRNFSRVYGVGVTAVIDVKV